MVAEITNAGRVPAENAVQEFEARLRGELIRPDDGEYETARAVWTASAAGRPALIVRAAGEADVVATVRFAREQGLLLAVRSGGHSFAGHGTVEGGIVLDLSGMKALEIDPVARVAWAQPGLTWGEYARAAQEYGLATSSGDMGSVGIGGLTLGGGIGWMVRKQGLTIDNLLAVEIVTADGLLLRASETEHPDLFWALRGGGGNFGVAVSFEFRLHPVGMVLGGAVIYDGAEARSVLQAFRRTMIESPDELTAMAMVTPAPPLPFIPEEAHGKLMVMILACYSGDLEAGERAVAPLRSLGTPLADVLGPMPYAAIFDLTAEAAPKGLHHEVRSLYMEALSDVVIETVVEHAGRITSPMSLVQIRALGGAMARVPEEATAFAHRGKPFQVNIGATWFDGGEAETHRGWVGRLFCALRPQGSGVYVNFLANEGEGRVREAYKPATFARLAEVKRQYDPTNFFRVNQNIKPSV